MQFDATIIAGVLVLLTIVASVSTALQLYAKIMLGAATLPFIYSAFTLIFKSKKPVPDEVRLSNALKATSIGLLYLIAAIVGLLVGIQPNAQPVK